MEHKPFPGPSGQTAMEREGAIRVCVTIKRVRFRRQEQKSSIHGLYPHRSCCVVGPRAVSRTLWSCPKHFSLLVPGPRTWFPDPVLAVALPRGERSPQAALQAGFARSCHHLLDVDREHGAALFPGLEAGVKEHRSGTQRVKEAREGTLSAGGGLVGRIPARPAGCL